MKTITKTFIAYLIILLSLDFLVWFGPFDPLEEGSFTMFAGIVLNSTILCFIAWYIRFSISSWLYNRRIKKIQKQITISNATKDTIYQVYLSGKL